MLNGARCGIRIPRIGEYVVLSCSSGLEAMDTELFFGTHNLEFTLKTYPHEIVAATGSVIMLHSHL